MTDDTTMLTFGARSTADDVLRGIDLTGTTAVVTGGHSGLGLETTRALLRAGAHIVVGARRPDAAREAIEGVVGRNGVDVHELDMADLDSVRSFAAAVMHDHPVLDVVVANAGVMACPETRVGPGWEAQFAVNHLGHFALVNLLWPALQASGRARVVAVASGYDPAFRIDWDDVMFVRGYDKWRAYAQSKHANILFSRHLDALGKPQGIRAFSATPGYILTPLQRHLTEAEMRAAGWIDVDGRPAPGLFKTAAQGAATQVWAATSPMVQGSGGQHCVDCAVVATDARDVGNDDEAVRLWQLSSELTGIGSPAL